MIDRGLVHFYIERIIYVIVQCIWRPEIHRVCPSVMDRVCVCVFVRCEQTENSICFNVFSS